MKKVLFSATVDSHILAFHLPYLEWFKEQGYEVHVATNGAEQIPYCDVKHTVSFERSPFKMSNLKAIKQLKQIIEKEQFDIIHTHTPMGSVVTRLAARKARKKFNTKIIYTAHGFHFYKGAPFHFWAIFYPVEKFLSKYTDVLITINQEDYELAKNKFKKTKVEFVPGVGIDEKKFDFKMSIKEKEELRNSLGLKKNDFVMIYVAEISKRKNQEWLINTLKPLLDENTDMHLLLAGRDNLDGLCQELTKELNLINQIHFLGFRSDIPKLLKMSNLLLSSSRQEGLPVNIIEAMACGLSIVMTDCRGNRDLIDETNEIYLCEQENENQFQEAVEKVYNILQVSKKEIINRTVYKIYGIETILHQLSQIYKDVM